MCRPPCCLPRCHQILPYIQPNPPTFFAIFLHFLLFYTQSFLRSSFVHYPPFFKFNLEAGMWNVLHPFVWPILLKGSSLPYPAHIDAVSWRLSSLVPCCSKSTVLPSPCALQGNQGGRSPAGPLISFWKWQLMIAHNCRLTAPSIYFDISKKSDFRCVSSFHSTGPQTPFLSDPGVPGPIYGSACL